MTPLIPLKQKLEAERDKLRKQELSILSGESNPKTRAELSHTSKEISDIEAKISLLSDLIEERKAELKKLKKGCGGFEEYWGHKCKSRFTNTSGNLVTVFCNKCVAQQSLLEKELGLKRSDLEPEAKE